MSSDSESSVASSVVSSPPPPPPPSPIKKKSKSTTKTSKSTTKTSSTKSKTSSTKSTEDKKRKSKAVAPPEDSGSESDSPPTPKPKKKRTKKEKGEDGGSTKVGKKEKTPSTQGDVVAPKKKKTTKKSRPDVEELSTGRTRPQPPLRYDYSPENHHRARVWAYWQATRESHSAWTTRMKHEEKAEWDRITAPSRVTDEDATLQDYRDFLSKAKDSDFESCTDKWLSCCGFEGRLSSKEIKEGETLPRADYILALYKECLKRNIQPLGIVSETSKDLIKEKDGQGKEHVVNWTYVFDVPEGSRLYVGDSIPLREAWRIAHPLARKKTIKVARTRTDRLGVGQSYCPK